MKRKARMIIKPAFCFMLLLLPAILISCTEAANIKTKNIEQKNYSTVSAVSISGGNATRHANATWYADIVREQLGIELQFLHTDGTDMQQLLNALIAGGDLPDIIVLSNFEEAITVASMGLVLNLDEYKEELPSIFNNPLMNAAVQFSREVVSSDKDGLFSIPSNIGIQDSLNFDIQLRWDIYQKIGAPTIYTLEDYLPVLKQMMDIYPTTEHGKPVWGISLFNDWDDVAMNLAHWTVTFNYGHDGETVSPLAETPVDASGKPRSILHDDSYYKRALQFFFDANQMGILDPDSITQNYDTLYEKYSEGRVLLSPWEWSVFGFNISENTDAEDFKGYASVWADDFKTMNYPDLPTGRGWAVSISANAKDLDAALKYLDWFYSFEGTDILYNGPQGSLWDVNDDGMRYITDNGWYIIQDDSEMPGGGRLSRAIQALNIFSLSGHTINPATINQTLDYRFWDSSTAQASSRLTKDWQNHHDGHMSMLQRGKETGQVIKGHPALHMMAPLPGDLYSLSIIIGNIIRTDSWMMVFAENQDEFDILWREMQSKAVNSGINEIINRIITDFEVAVDTAERFTSLFEESR